MLTQITLEFECDCHGRYYIFHQTAGLDTHFLSKAFAEVGEHQARFDKGITITEINETHPKFLMNDCNRDEGQLDIVKQETEISVESLRYDASLVCLQGILSNPNYLSVGELDLDLVRCAVEYGDGLLRTLSTPDDRSDTLFRKQQPKGRPPGFVETEV